MCFLRILKTLWFQNWFSQSVIQLTHSQELGTTVYLTTLVGCLAAENCFQPPYFSQENCRFQKIKRDMWLCPLDHSIRNLELAVHPDGRQISRSKTLAATPTSLGECILCNLWRKCHQELPQVQIRWPITVLPA
jgi:hypothetical protein